MMKKHYDRPEFDAKLFQEEDVVLASNNGQAINSDQWDNETSGGFDL